MFVAMNRFRIHVGREDDFEIVWRNRDSKLAGFDGFLGFHLLRGRTDRDLGITHYISHSMWTDEASFLAWTKSESFRAAHRNAGDLKGEVYDGPPVFEGYTSVVDG